MSKTHVNPKSEGGRGTNGIGCEVGLRDAPASQLTDISQCIKDYYIQKF